MNKNSIATPFGIWWSLMAGGVMVAENPETVHIFLPYEIIEVDAVGDNLIVVTRPDMEGKACSFTLNPETVLPSVAEMAQKAGLPIAQYAASKIRYAKDEQQREDQRLNALSQAFCHDASPSFGDRSLSVIRNRVFIVYQIMISALFAAMVYYGHDRGHEYIPLTNYPTEVLCMPPQQQAQKLGGELIPKPEEGGRKSEQYNSNRGFSLPVANAIPCPLGMDIELIVYLILHDCSGSGTIIKVSG
jgi:hypothetical protein